jgi:hypothetical protein
MSRCSDIIQSRLEAVAKDERFKTWSKSGIPVRDGLAILNNSFLFREATRSAKSSLYLAFDVAGGVVDQSKQRVVTRLTRQNVDFQFAQVPSKDVQKVQPMDETLAELVETFGRVGFVLIGELHDDLKFEAALDVEGPFSKIVLDPSCSDAVQVRDGAVHIRELID